MLSLTYFWHWNHSYCYTLNQIQFGTLALFVLIIVLDWLRLKKSDEWEKGRAGSTITPKKSSRHPKEVLANLADIADDRALLSDQIKQAQELVTNHVETESKKAGLGLNGIQFGSWRTINGLDSSKKRTLSTWGHGQTALKNMYKYALNDMGTIWKPTISMQRHYQVNSAVCVWSMDTHICNGEGTWWIMLVHNAEKSPQCSRQTWRSMDHYQSSVTKLQTEDCNWRDTVSDIRNLVHIVSSSGNPHTGNGAEDDQEHHIMSTSWNEAMAQL